MMNFTPKSSEIHIFIILANCKDREEKSFGSPCEHTYSGAAEIQNINARTGTGYACK